MSVLVVSKFQGDTAKFRQALQDRAGEFDKVAERAKSAGAIHHRFGIGDGVVVVVDEWGSAEQFQAFFSDPELQEFIASTGAAAGPPDLTISEAVSSSDQF
jgi:heme-degrading monooxygenase HmoA